MKAYKHVLYWSFLCAGVLLSSPALHAMFMQPQNVPVERLLKNAQAYLEQNKGEAEAYYTLGRIHYLAFHLGKQEVPAFDRPNTDGRPKLAPNWMLRYTASPDPQPKPVSDAQRSAHAVLAMKNFDEALRLAPGNALYLLGRASLMQEFAESPLKDKTADVPPDLKELTPQKIRAAYFKAFSQAIDPDSKMKVKPVAGLESLVSFEAGSAFKKLASKDAASLSAAEKQQLEKVDQGLAMLNALPQGPITPIIFMLQPAHRIAELLAPERTVAFDLRGYGRPERWPWVKADTGFVVWDPLDRGDIQSARQMFGSYTFQMFWRTGYDALRALDDNRDGMLTGSELEGISAWFDRNGDARSTRDEVKPLRQFGVSALSVDATALDSVHPMNPAGIVLEDGRTLPTWDWMVEPVSP